MKLKYLGTAAAEGIPAIFCDCESCRKSIALGGRNIRTRSQAIVDDKLLIDFPCDTYYHSIAGGIDLSKIRNCLITHIHEDHFYPREFHYLKKGFSKPNDNWSISVYGSEDLKPEMDDIAPKVGGFLKYYEISPFKPFTVENYTVTALKAYHGTAHPYIYMISDGEKNLLYAHDTDVFPEETWDYLCADKPHFDLVSLDCTEGATDNITYRGHMNLNRNIECREIMEKHQLADKSTKFILNHFSHNGTNCLYDELIKIAEKNRFDVSFDGMEVVI